MHLIAWFNCFLRMLKSSCHLKVICGLTSMYFRPTSNIVFLFLLSWNQQICSYRNFLDERQRVTNTSKLSSLKTYFNAITFDVLFVNKEPCKCKIDRLISNLYGATKKSSKQIITTSTILSSQGIDTEREYKGITKSIIIYSLWKTNPSIAE